MTNPFLHHPACTGCPITPNAAIVAPVAGEGRLTRRTFLSQAVLGAAALALAACAADSILTPFSGSASVNISSYPSLATVGGVALVTLNGSPIALVRDTDTSVIALSRICPHQGGNIGTGNGGFVCPRHGAQFSLTGQWTGGERTTNMRSYATTFDVTTGDITVG